MTARTEVEGILALLLLAIVVLAWLAVEVRDLHAALEPVLSSRLVTGLSSV